MANQPETTIHDIAKKLNLSASTVSRALQDNPVISEATRNLIKRVADEMGYRPNILAANLRTRRTNTIGVIVPLINRHFFSSVISGVEDVAYNLGFTVTISQSNDKLEKECKIAQTLFANRVDGVILSIGMETYTFDHLKVFSERKIPIVFFDRVVDEIKAHKIVADDYGGGYRATQHLINQGATKIVHIGGPLHLKIYQDRQKGYCDALNEAGININESLIINNSLSREEGTTAIKKLMHNQEKPDAVFCANDTTALSVIIFLKENGLKVPDDVAVVGFSNEPFTEMVTPSISTVKQPGFLMGQKAAQLIIQQILHDHENPVFKTIVMPTELIIRDSSKFIKKA
ncbi:MAG TPA: LacI family DNA-binding transcriptional regulator [Draconibacterium sp.]|jgi:LacI family transcriptional regulator|nr:LacI family DNA-binding transcriptional regulator [Draconibacterium sp.]